MLRWISFFIVFLLSLHIVVTRLSKVKSVYAEGKKIRESAGSIEIENVAIDFPFIVFQSSLHVAATRLSMVKFVYAERLALYLLDIFFAYL